MGGSAASNVAREDDLPAGEDPELTIRYFAAEKTAVAVAPRVPNTGPPMLPVPDNITPDLVFKTIGVHKLRIQRVETNLRRSHILS